MRKAFVEALQKEFHGWGLKFSIGGQVGGGTSRPKSRRRPLHHTDAMARPAPVSFCRLALTSSPRAGTRRTAFATSRRREASRRSTSLATRPLRCAGLQPPPPACARLSRPPPSLAHRHPWLLGRQRLRDLLQPRDGGPHRDQLEGHKVRTAPLAWAAAAWVPCQCSLRPTVVFFFFFLCRPHCRAQLSALFNVE